MDVIKQLSSPEYGAITCVEMHTVGMPTRIVMQGYPTTTGTLLEQKEEARMNHDDIRKLFLHEPRGHADMFGAILRPCTELTTAGKAHMGLLYVHGDGYSNMCGHATIAVGRFLIDTHDLDVFPRRNDVRFDAEGKTAQLVLHAPGGLVEVTVPTNSDGSRSDPTRPVSFIATSAYALATKLTVHIPQEYRWPELGNRDTVEVELAYCGAISCQVQALGGLGFSGATLLKPIKDFSSLKNAARQLRDAINANPEYRQYLCVPGQEAPGSLYGVMITDRYLRTPPEGSRAVHAGLYFFGDMQIDRSPTGSAAAARNALAYANGALKVGDSWAYQSLVSQAFVTEGLTATIVHAEGRQEHEAGHSAGPVWVRVAGQAFYTGTHTFVVETKDPLGESGFLLEKINPGLTTRYYLGEDEEEWIRQNNP
ncbi:hypothetical protein B0T10DRAFT_493163 [Thelonectria olida]|uniref:trans-L-3-hydroxyproline dehydratase n=1 Tax=Thelonectria olida TaxID=1576542 RepID=A0A9P9ALA7_9HYPO|nr:hypothetical protein B0T10DRAFT_493163 [Thelonectria olida]